MITKEQNNPHRIQTRNYKMTIIFRFSFKKMKDFERLHKSLLRYIKFFRIALHGVTGRVKIVSFKISNNQIKMSEESQKVHKKQVKTPKSRRATL